MFRISGGTRTRSPCPLVDLRDGMRYNARMPRSKEQLMQSVLDAGVMLRVSCVKRLILLRNDDVGEALVAADEVMDRLCLARERVRALRLGTLTFRAV